MCYYLRFGFFGTGFGRFQEPGSVAVTKEHHVLVADTNSHCIQRFSNGHFLSQFGEEGRRDGQLMFPNRLNVCRLTDNIVVTERTPTHQVQVFTSEGQFIRKFGGEILQFPRGVCVDRDGRILVLECKVMRVVIFDPTGNILNQFKCEKLKFPNSIAVDSKYRVYVCDNKAHCVLVFNYSGEFLGSVGHVGITNYPIGVAVRSDGTILIADNHNNFNITLFNTTGEQIMVSYHGEHTYWLQPSILFVDLEMESFLVAGLQKHREARAMLGRCVTW